MKAFGYIRVSTDKQGELGLGSEAQKAAIEAYCTAQNWDLEMLPVDVASGKSTNGRHSYRDGLARLSRREADVLVAAKLDRLSRSTVDFGTLLEQAKRQGWAVACLDLGMDMSTPVGEMVAGIVVQVAQFERRRIAERTKMAMDELPRTEHRNVNGELKQAPGRKRQIAPAVEAQIRWLRAKGLTLQAIASTLAEQGQTPPAGRAWRTSTIQRVLARKEV